MKKRNHVFTIVLFALFISSTYGCNLKVEESKKRRAYKTSNRF